jgi:hypothetical protein
MRSHILGQSRESCARSHIFYLQRRQLLARLGIYVQLLIRQILGARVLGGAQNGAAYSRVCLKSWRR